MTLSYHAPQKNEGVQLPLRIVEGLIHNMKHHRFAITLHTFCMERGSV